MNLCLLSLLKIKNIIKKPSIYYNIYVFMITGCVHESKDKYIGKVESGNPYKLYYYYYLKNYI